MPWQSVFLLPAPETNMCRFFPFPTFQTSAVCPTIQFSSDTIYLELHLDPIGQRLSLTRLSPLDRMVVNWGVPITSSSGLIIF
jgi:hypothetical protein